MWGRVQSSTGSVPQQSPVWPGQRHSWHSFGLTQAEADTRHCVHSSMTSFHTVSTSWKAVGGENVLHTWAQRKLPVECGSRISPAPGLRVWSLAAQHVPSHPGPGQHFQSNGEGPGLWLSQWEGAAGDGGSSGAVPGACWAEPLGAPHWEVCSPGGRQPPQPCSWHHRMPVP